MDANRESETCVKFILRDSSTCTVPLECIPPDSLFAVLVRARQLAENDISAPLDVPVDSVDARDAHSILCALHANYLIDKHVQPVNRDVRLYTGVSSTLLSSHYRRARAREVLRRGLQRWSLKRLFRGRSYKPLSHQVLFSKLLVVRSQLASGVHSWKRVTIDLPIPSSVFAVSRIIPLVDFSKVWSMQLVLKYEDTSTLPRAPQYTHIKLFPPFESGLLPQLLPVGDRVGYTMSLEIAYVCHTTTLPDMPVFIMTHTTNERRPIQFLPQVCRGYWGYGDFSLEYNQWLQKLCMAPKGKNVVIGAFNTRLQNLIDFCLTKTQLGIE
jgi:hypothetical protein